MGCMSYMIWFFFALNFIGNNLWIIECMNLPVAQTVDHGASNTKIVGLIPRESKS